MYELTERRNDPRLTEVPFLGEMEKDEITDGHYSYFGGGGWHHLPELLYVEVDFRPGNGKNFRPGVGSLSFCIIVTGKEKSKS